VGATGAANAQPAGPNVLVVLEPFNQHSPQVQRIIGYTVQQVRERYGEGWVHVDLSSRGVPSSGNRTAT
jgi:hypothetical protein